MEIVHCTLSNVRAWYGVSLVEATRLKKTLQAWIMPSTGLSISGCDDYAVDDDDDIDEYDDDDDDYDINLQGGWTWSETCDSSYQWLEHGKWSAFGSKYIYLYSYSFVWHMVSIWSHVTALLRLFGIKYDGKDWYLITKRWNSWLPWLARACGSLPWGRKQSCCRKRCNLYFESQGVCIEKYTALFQDRDARMSFTPTNR